MSYSVTDGLVIVSADLRSALDLLLSVSQINRQMFLLFRPLAEFLRDDRAYTIWVSTKCYLRLLIYPSPILPNSP